MTVDEMKAFVVEKMREMKIPRFLGAALCATCTSSNGGKLEPLVPQGDRQR